MRKQLIDIGEGGRNIGWSVSDRDLSTRVGGTLCLRGCKVWVEVIMMAWALGTDTHVAVIVM